MLAVEELSRVDPSVGVLVDVQNTLVINAVLRWGSEDVRHRYLPRLASKAVSAYALSEAGSGSDAFALTTRATEAGDGYVLSGRKLGSQCNEADIFISSRPSIPPPAIAASPRSSSNAASRVHHRQERGKLGSARAALELSSRIAACPRERPREVGKVTRRRLRR